MARLLGLPIVAPSGRQILAGPELRRSHYRFHFHPCVRDRTYFRV